MKRKKIAIFLGLALAVNSVSAFAEEEVGTSADTEMVTDAAITDAESADTETVADLEEGDMETSADTEETEDGEEQEFLMGEVKAVDDGNIIIQLGTIEGLTLPDQKPAGEEEDPVLGEKSAEDEAEDEKAADGMTQDESAQEDEVSGEADEDGTEAAASGEADESKPEEGQKLEIKLTDNEETVTVTEDTIILQVNEQEAMDALVMLSGDGREDIKLTEESEVAEDVTGEDNEETAEDATGEDNAETADDAMGEDDAEAAEDLTAEDEETKSAEGEILAGALELNVDDIQAGDTLIVRLADDGNAAQIMVVTEE